MRDLLSSVLLIDDCASDNFFHERVIRKSGRFKSIVVRESGAEALEYLRSGAGAPALIFLDINMPGMNGWEFLEQYESLDPTLQGEVLVVMLTTSDDPRDVQRAHQLRISPQFKTKPLTLAMLEELLAQHLKSSPED